MDGRYIVTELLLVCLITLLSMTKSQQTVTNVANSSSSVAFPDCPSNIECDRLAGNCLEEIKTCNHSCTYGEESDIHVTVLDVLQCIGERNHTRRMKCRYCYQTDESEYTCSTKADCKSVGTYSSRVYRSNCTVRPDVLCFGKRKFYKNRVCHWTNGYSWRTTMLLSITLGGFGVDRFYLGHWKEGIGKLFSFGGLGVWTLIDVILIALGYVTPSDGSLYTYQMVNISQTEYTSRLSNLL